MNKIRNKIVLLGDAYVGKTSIAIRFSKEEFNENTESTFGAVYFTHTLIKDEQKLQFDIWDTAGQERFKALGVLYYKSAKGALVVYDMTNKKSFERAIDWVLELHEKADPDIVIGLVGNKSDLEEAREVSKEEAIGFSTKHGLLNFECSAKTGFNIKDIFLVISFLISEKYTD